MERFAWKGRIKPGMQTEYKRRHDEIWPEMKQVLKDAGIRNYTIWSDGETLFGYYECEKGIAYAEQTQAGSPVERLYAGCAGAGDGSEHRRPAQAAADVPAGVNPVLKGDGTAPPLFLR